MFVNGAQSADKSQWLYQNSFLNGFRQLIRNNGCVFAPNDYPRDQGQAHIAQPDVMCPTSSFNSLCSLVKMVYIIYLLLHIYHSMFPWLSREFCPVLIVWPSGHLSWWRHQMETSSALLALSAGNSSYTQRPVTWSFDVSFDLRLNKRLCKQSWGWWFQTPSRTVWRHHNFGLLRCSSSLSNHGKLIKIGCE